MSLLKMQNRNKTPEIKRVKRLLILIISAMLSILFPTIILPKMPSNGVTKENQRREIIVIGEIYDKGGALLVKNPLEKPGKPPLTRFIVVKVVDVIKGDGKIKSNNLIHLISQCDPEKQYDSYIPLTNGISPVQTIRGSFVIVFADTIPNNPGFYSIKTIFPLFNSTFFMDAF
jgi:hypothetical protein